jgi:hypothetical protein
MVLAFSKNEKPTQPRMKRDVNALYKSYDLIKTKKRSENLIA